MSTYTNARSGKSRILFYVSFIVLCSIFVLAFSNKAHAKYRQKTYHNFTPFKSLKIGSKKYTKKTKLSYLTMDTTPFKEWDGGLEVFLGDYRKKVKKGGRLKYKLKSGFKATFHISYTDKKGKSHFKKIKNNAKLPYWDKDFYLIVHLKKGKYKSVLFLEPYKEEDA